MAARVPRDASRRFCAVLRFRHAPVGARRAVRCALENRRESCHRDSGDPLARFGVYLRGPGHSWPIWGSERLTGQASIAGSSSKMLAVWVLQPMKDDWPSAGVATIQLRRDRSPEKPCRLRPHRGAHRRSGRPDRAAHSPAGQPLTLPGCQGDEVSGNPAPQRRPVALAWWPWLRHG